MQVNYGGVDYQLPPDTTDEEALEFLENVGAYEVEQGAPAVEMGRSYEDPDITELEKMFSIGVDPNQQSYEAGEVEFMKLKPEQKQFVDRIRQLETGGLQNPFIRTKAKGTGSSAYGPYQITRGLIQAQLKSNPDMFTPQEQQAMQDLAKRQSIALAVGGRDRATYSPGGAKQAQGAAWAKQYGFDSVDAFLSAFDYGGDYGLSGNSDFQILYESLAHKMLVSQLDETGGDGLEAASRWHGGKGWKRASSRQHTDIYRQRYEKLS